MSVKNKCAARIAEFEDMQYFADGRHRFYFETRCNRACRENMNVCLDCSRKNPDSRTQYSRTFDHGLVTEPVPDKSDIYGGKRYLNNAKKWGEPGADVIREAERKKELSVQEKQITVPNITAAEEYKVMTHISGEIAAVKPHTVVMPRKAKDPIKTGIIPIATASETNTSVLEQAVIAAEPVEKKVRKRPQVAAKKVEVAAVIAEQKEEKKESLKEEVKEEPKEKVKPKATVPRKKKTETPYTALAKVAAAKNPLSALNKQEVCIPTHIEKTLETVDTDGYEIEYVKLTKFEHDGVKYFRDMKKQKLYERVKDTSVGKYVGRYDSYSDSIIEDVPDSDSD